MGKGVHPRRELSRTGSVLQRRGGGILCHEWVWRPEPGGADALLHAALHASVRVVRRGRPAPQLHSGRSSSAARVVNPLSSSARQPRRSPHHCSPSPTTTSQKKGHQQRLAPWQGLAEFVQHGAAGRCLVELAGEHAVEGIERHAQQQWRQQQQPEGPAWLEGKGRALGHRKEQSSPGDGIGADRAGLGQGPQQRLETGLEVVDRGYERLSLRRWP